MKIVTEYWRKPSSNRNHDWSAIDTDSYDGAPDASPRCRAIGYGRTERDAVIDLMYELDLADSEATEA